MPTAGPPGDRILQQRDPSDPICSSSAPTPLLQKGMPGSASKQKEVIDPAEEKEEPEARDRDSNWKNAMLMLLPKSILPARSCCGCGALCWTFGDSQIWRGVWQIPCIRKHLQTAYERCRKPKEATRNYLRLQTGRRGSRQPSCSQHRLFKGVQLSTHRLSPISSLHMSQQADALQDKISWPRLDGQRQIRQQSVPPAPPSPGDQ